MSDAAEHLADTMEDVGDVFTDLSTYARNMNATGQSIATWPLSPQIEHVTFAIL